MSAELLKPHKTINAAAAKLIEETERFLETGTHKRNLGKAIGKRVLEGLICLGNGTGLAGFVYPSTMRHNHKKP